MSIRSILEVLSLISYVKFNTAPVCSVYKVIEKKGNQLLKNNLFKGFKGQLKFLLVFTVNVRYVVDIIYKLNSLFNKFVFISY